MATPTKVLAPSPGTGEKGLAVKIYPAGQDSIVYTNGRAVVVRNLSDPAKTLTYFGHVHPATVATVSPSGYYVASADVTGLVKVWDLVGEDHVTKLETRALTGRTNDLCWDGESKRLIAAGEGKERYGHGFTSDSGNSTGEIGGHSKPINAVAIRHQRPFRAVTASDDYTLVFHTGVPWKFNKVIRTHSAFVQALAYSPTGDHFVSAGSDRKIFLYDGKEGDVLTPDGLTGHQGTVYAVAFNKSGDQIMSASADGTVKLWSVPDGKELASWTVPGQQQQVGGCFLGNGNFVAVSLTGDLSVIDPTSKDGKPVRSYYGHQKGITGLARSGDSLISGSYDGKVNSFSVSSGECTPVQGPEHSSAIVGLAAAGASSVVSAALDDTVKAINADSKAVDTSFSASASMPKGLAADPNGTAYVLTPKSVQIISSSQSSSSIDLNFEPSSAIAYSTAQALLAVGGEDSKVRLYQNAQLLKTLDNSRSAISALAFSPDGKWLAVGESNGKILLFDTTEWAVKTSQWAFHTARISSLAFSEDSMFCLSGSLDTALYVWSVARPVKKVAMKNVHYGGVTGVCWTGANEIASTGADATVRMHKIALPGL